MLPHRRRTHLAQQLFALASSVLVGLFWYAVWGPPSGLKKLPSHWRVLAESIITIWLVIEAAFVVRWLAARRPAVRTELGTFTLWSGVVSCASLFTGFLLGWMALLLAPAGLVTGIVVLVREVRSQSGNDLRNIAGIALCAGAVVFLTV